MWVHWWWLAALAAAAIEDLVHSAEVRSAALECNGNGLVELARSVLVEHAQQIRGRPAEVSSSLGELGEQLTARGNGVVQPIDTAMLPSLLLVRDEPCDMGWVLDGLSAIPSARMLCDHAVAIDDLFSRYASDLGNILGDVRNRVHPFAPPLLGQPDPGPLERELVAAVETAAKSSAAAFDACSPTRALEAIWAGLGAANAYVDKVAPWTARKREAERLDTVVTALGEALEAFSVMVALVMPQVALGMRQQLGLQPLAPALDHDVWPLTAPRRPAGQTLVRGERLFPRLDKKQVAALQIRFRAPDEQSAEPAAATDAAEEPSTISYDDFAKLDLRVAVVVSAERIKRKDRLLALEIDVGDEQQRSLVAGVATSYTPEQLVGKRIVVLCNLEPRAFGKKLVSHGMLLAAAGAEGVHLLTPDAEIAPGSKVR